MRDVASPGSGDCRRQPAPSPSRRLQCLEGGRGSARAGWGQNGRRADRRSRERTVVALGKSAARRRTPKRGALVIDGRTPCALRTS
jgi:hypothetical protein